jgi:hypothetical protein
MERADTRVGVVALLAVLAGCASLPPCPAEGGPRWTEWRTPSFRLLTALGDERAEGLVSAFEEFRLALLVAAWRGGREPAEPIDVVVLKDDSELGVFAPESVAGFVAAQPAGIPVIVTYAGVVLMEDAMLKHELAHALAHQMGIGRNAPAWFNEGLADYLSAVRYTAGGSRVRFGEPAAQRERDVVRHGLMRFEQLWKVPPLQLSDRFYATSWLLVHYLFNQEPKRFEAFQRALGSEEDGRRAWESAFPDLDGARVDAALVGYLNSGRFSTYEGIRPKPRFSIVSQEIRDSEVHGLRSLLYATGPQVAGDWRTLARAEVGRALREDPLDLRALVVERVHLNQRRADVQTARRLVERHPDRADAWMLLALAHRTLGQNDAAEAVLSEARAHGLSLDGPPVPHIARPY